MTAHRERAASILRDLLAETRGADDVVVKINVEGAAGGMILSTSPGDWDHVRAIWCDVEVTDPAGANAILEHLSGCGFEGAEVDGNRHLFVKALARLTPWVRPVREADADGGRVTQPAG